MLEAGQRYDDDALAGLYAFLRPDVVRVLSAILVDHRLVEDAYQDVRVRIFVYLPRFKFPPDASDVSCQEYLRRWATNLARNWARLINKYGIVEAQGRWTFPRFVMGDAARPRRGVLRVQAIEHDGEAFEGETAEQRVERAALQAFQEGRMVSV